MFKAEEVRNGVQAIWNSQIEEADNIFSEQKDTNPRHALHYAENLWFWSFLTDNKSLQAEAGARLKQSKKLAEENYKKCSKKSKSEPGVVNEQIESLVIYGETILFQAFHQMSATFDYARACMGLSKSWGYIQEAEKLSKLDGADEELILLVKFDLGLFLFFLSFLPEVLGFAAKVLSLMGFKGDRVKGFAYLDEVAKSDSIRAPFAYAILIAKYLYISENVFPIDPATSNLSSAVAALDGVLAKCPNGLAFLSLRGSTLRRQGKHAESITLFEDIKAQFLAKNADASLASLNIGHAYFNLFSWEEAIPHFVAVEESPVYLRSYCATMFKGICEVMLGDLDKGHASVGLSLKAGKNDGDFKSFCERYTNNAQSGVWETLIERGDLVWESEEDIAKAQAALKDFQRDMGINGTDKGETEITKQLKHSRKTKDSNQMIFHYVQAQLDSLTGNTEGAIKNFGIVVSNMKTKNSLDKKMLWQSYFELADIHYKQGDKEKATALLKKTSKDGSSSFQRAAKEALVFIGNQ